MSDNTKNSLAGMLAGAILLGLVLIGFGRTPKDVLARAHAEFCPAVLAHATTYPDSIAVIEEHTGCWEFVHPPRPSSTEGGA